MKNKSLFKRALSIVLCAVMLVSCWVFTAPSAEAANNTTAGTYDVYITFNVTDTADSWFGDGYGSGYTYDNKTAGDRVGITVFHKNNNGWGDTESHTDFDLYPSSGTKPIKVSGEQNTGTTFFGIGFPTSIYAYNDHGNAVDGTNYKITKVQIKKAGAATSTYQTIFEGNLVAGSSFTGIKYCWLKSDGTHTQDGGSVENNKGWTAKFPYVASGGTLTRSADITLDGQNEKSSLITKAVATDQYGVTYAAANCTLSRTCSYSSSAITIDGNYLKATTSAHIDTTNINSQNVTVTGTWAGSQSVKKTVTVKITDETYPSYWKYYVTNPSDPDNPTLETETVNVYYGDEYNCQVDNAYVYVPTVTNYYYTTANHYTGGTFTTDSNISKWSSSSNSGTIITMGYTEAAHTFTDHYEDISDNHTVHRAYCSCGYSKIDDVQSNHVYGDWEEVDATNHQRVCARCDHVETAAHTFTAWSVTVPEDAALAAVMKADYNASAECFRYCTKCYRVEYKAHDYNSVRTEATCLDSGEIVYTCKYCSTTYNEDIPASGHAFELTAVQPNDKVSGYTCYHCTNCDNYWNAPYDGGYTTPDLDSATGIADPGQLNNSDTIPAPYFNDFKEDYDGDGNVDYAYGERGSGLKLMKNSGEFNAATTKQDFRFSGSVAIPKDISYEIGRSNDNVIVDFGFVYSQDSYIESDTSRLVLNSGDSKIASMSVVNTNAANGNVTAVNDSTGRLIGEDGEWSGVTFHPGDGSDEFPDSLTFNLVISIKATNWKMQYAARPYITYTYHGETYTVYDTGASAQGGQVLLPEYSCCSVYSLASYIAVWNPDNSAAKYCTDNILAHEALLYPTRFDDNKKSDEFTDWWKWIEGDTSWSDFINPNRQNGFYKDYCTFMNNYQ